MTEDQLKKEFTRVTEILYPYSGLSEIDPKIVMKAAERGTRVHNICEGILKGFGEWGVDDETRGFVESFKIWHSQGVKPVEIEKRFYCEDLMITGQVDMIIETPNGLSILDLKTSYKPSKTWPLQGSAYAYMAKKHGYDIKNIQFLHLKKNGSAPKIFEYEDHFDLFKKCLDVYRYFK